MAKFKIRELAKKQGITNAAQLSRQANIGQTTAYKLWDGSTYQPNVDTLIAIAEVLGVKIDDLIVEDDTGESKIELPLFASALVSCE